MEPVLYPLLRGDLVSQGNLIFSVQFKMESLFPLLKGERGGLVVNASDSGSRGQGFEPHSGQTVLCP